MSKKKEKKVKRRSRLIKSCLRCNRPLTNKQSMERGYGRICVKKIGVPLERKKFKQGSVWTPHILKGQKRLRDFL